MCTSRLLGAVCASLLFSVVSVSQAASVITFDQRFIDTITYAYGGSNAAPYLRDQRRSDGNSAAFNETASLTSISTCDPLYDSVCNALGDTVAQADANATLNSTATPYLFSASGSTGASGSFDANNPSAGYQAISDSSFSVVFSLDSAYQYSLWGTIDNPSNPFGYGDSAIVQLFTNGTGTPVSDSFNTTGAFTSSGILGPGDYYVYGAASTYVDSISGLLRNPGSFDFTLTLTAVPVPPALYLFGSGLLGLVGIARRKKAV